jgi:hypothetical protein
MRETAFVLNDVVPKVGAEVWSQLVRRVVP